MRRIAIFIVSVLMAIPAVTARQYASSSALSSGHIVKMQIDESGIYCVTYDQIVSSGLNPDKIAVLGYGGALLEQNFSLPKIDDVPSVAVYINKGSDGKFNKGDYLLFYAQGIIGWKYNNGTFEHTRNHYANHAYYFLSDADGLQRTVGTAEELDNDHAFSVTSYNARLLHEQELVNLIDANKGTDGGGREFYGEKVTNGSSLKIKFNFTDTDISRKQACKIDFAVNAQGELSKVTATSADVTKTQAMSNINDFYTFGIPAFMRLNDINASANPVVNIEYSSPNNNDVLYLNYVEMHSYSKLHLSGNELSFRNIDNIGSKYNNIYKLTGCDKNTQIWCITKLDSIYRMPAYIAGDTMYFTGSNKSCEEYIAVRTNTADYKTPVILGSIPNQDLHALQNIDYVIVTPKEWLSEAERLGEAHWQAEELNYAAVTDEEVYNEFSSGTPDASAIRWLMKMLYDRAGDDESKRPKYLLLFGDGTFDNRKILSTSGKATLITYQAKNSTVETMAYATDDYFAFLEDKDGMIGTVYTDTYGVMRIGVGRLPVNTQDEARQVVDKLVAYINNTNPGSWRQQLCFLADDGDHNQHTRISDAAAETVRANNESFVVNKIYLDAYPQERSASTESYPIAYNRFTNLLRDGVLFMDYSGHGSANNICNEMFLTLASVQQMNNANQGFWMLATCSYAHFDKAAISSAEAAVLNPRGGAIGVMSACRTVFASDNEILNTNFCNLLFNNNGKPETQLTLGEAAQLAKNQSGRKENKLSYVLLADPALKLHYPTANNVVATAQSDTLRALQQVELSGAVINLDGDTAYGFNGNAKVSIWDKMQVVNTRDNDESDNSKKQIYSYNDHPNLLFAGTAEVKDGRFSLVFRMPKDIHYNYGYGRIVMYASDTQTDEEGIGYSGDFVIGGSDAAALMIEDTIGPDISLYMDNIAFQDGGKTSPNPHFYADVYDENGINTVGSGIGHDLMLIVDNNMKQTYTLNGYFTTINNNFRRGSVSYPMTEQTEGDHTLTFRAWDLLNNSSTATLHYTVVNNLAPQLYKVSIYPNPVMSSDNAVIAISSDRPDETLFTEIQIFNINGEKVYAKHITDDRIISFSPSEANMSGGMYVVKLVCSTPSSNEAKAVGKLIVL